MERVVERSNMRLAYQRVVENKGAAGVDDLGVCELKDWLPSGGIRTLGVPAVVDRLIQQALRRCAN